MSEILNIEPGLVVKLIGDVVSIGVAFVVSFVGCDFIYNDFSLSQSIKSSYWFFLGPFVWEWGTAVPWVFEILKNFAKGEWTSVEKAFVDWAEGLFPSWSLVALPPPSLVGSMIDDNGMDMLENFEYIRNRRFPEIGLGKQQ